MDIPFAEIALSLVVAVAVFGLYAVTRRIIRKRRQGRIDRFYRGDKP